MESAWKEGQSKEEWVMATCWLPGLAGSANFGRVWLGSATVGAGYGFGFSRELAGPPETLGFPPPPPGFLPGGPKGLFRGFGRLPPPPPPPRGPDPPAGADPLAVFLPWDMEGMVCI